MWVGLALHGDLAPVVGQELDGLGIRAWCTSVDAAAHERNGIVPTEAPPGANPTARYDITGTAGTARDYAVDIGSGETAHAGSEWVLTIAGTGGDLRLLACSNAVAATVPLGWVTVACTLSVINDYEWDAFTLPDVRTNWTVHDLVDTDGDHVLLDLAPG